MVKNIFHFISFRIILSHSLVLVSFLLHAQRNTEDLKSKIAFISDTQSPMWIEAVFLKSHHNEYATEILLNDIQLQNPSALFMPGDIVNLSCNKKRWEKIDNDLIKIRSAGIPVHGCLGNHEVMKRKKKGEMNFQARFPDHVNTGYVVKKDSIAVIFLNSNFSKMKKNQVLIQDNWYNQTLQELDTANDVKVVIVSCHHSPFSDSKLVGSSKDVQEKFIPGFIKSKKGTLFITGHAHLFQHFNIQGKDFLVIGGGGGLNHPLKKKSCGQVDLAKNYKPLFQYITISMKNKHLEVISHRLKEDFSGVEVGRRIEIELGGKN